MRISIRYSLAKSGNSDLPIRMRISYDGLRVDLRTGFVCPPEKWDTASMRVRSGAVNRYGEKAQSINRALSLMEATATDILSRYELDGKVPDPQVMKSDFERAMGRTDGESAKESNAGVVTLGSLFERFLSDHGREVSAGSIQTYITLKNFVDGISIASKAVDELTLADLSEFVNDASVHGYENQTVYNFVTILKSALRWGRRRGIYHGTVCDDFRYKFRGLGQKDVHYLEWDEFEKILYCQLPTPRQEMVRDAFCLCCSTGLRISDCIKLRWHDINLTSDVPHLKVLIKKTKKSVKVELNKWSRAIIDRRLSLGSVDPDGKVFDGIVLNTVNHLLHTIARKSGISGQVRYLSFVGSNCTERMVDKCDAISSHWGRHTFVVHALHLGISPEVITQWTGHSSINALKPYIAISDRTKVQNMALFDKD